MLIRQYETTILLGPDLDEAGCENIINFIKDLAKRESFTITTVDYMGKKTMAYQIKQFSEAHYYLLTFDTSTDFVSELERNLKINDKVLRFLTVKRSLRAKPFQRSMDEKPAVTEPKNDTLVEGEVEIGEDKDAGN